MTFSSLDNNLYILENTTVAGWRRGALAALGPADTTLPTDLHFCTFMPDPVYRMAVAWQNVAPHRCLHGRGDGRTSTAGYRDGDARGGVQAEED
jgi:hypothetical protein